VRIAPEWHWNIKHREEAARGLDDLEDLYRPACFSRILAPNEVCEIALSAEEHDLMPARAALVAELDRQGELRAAGIAEPALEHLKLAADQFVVERRDARGKPQGKTVIAGYPWFSDWGRDTMIALPGLLLATGRPHIAASVLRTFARFVDRGMLPNRFPDQGEAPEYNTVDAGLWFFVAVRAVFEQSRDTEFLKELYPILKDMIDWHVRGTRYGIGMDAADSLLRAGEAGVQLTWMDAKVGDWVVTPRTGKPVEINALWYNAVAIMAEFAGRLKRSDDSVQLRSLAIKIKQNFDTTFWYADGGYLYDVVDGEERDTSLRPNQLFALSLPHALLEGDRAKQVVDVCAAELLTPVGLRSLTPKDSRYIARYGGGPLERDGAYHQGTVWTWLLGPFVSAHYRVYGDAVAARRYLSGIAMHLTEGCIGQVSEIMDAAAPHEPRGCFAQAWGVAEILRTWSEINECERQESPRAQSA
jgi:predicted glycogen debranching enzyme